jgi:hypothetical protein
MIHVKHEHLLPRHFRLFGVIAIVFAFVYFSQHMDLTGVGVALVTTAVGLICLFGRYGLLVDPQGKQYMEFVLLLWIKKGDWKPYQGIEKIFINSARVSERMVTRSGAKYDFKSKLYQAYLKFDDAVKIELDSDTSKEKLLSRLNIYNKELNTWIQDNTV